MNLIMALVLAAAVDLPHSHLTVYVYKQGLFSFLADNHVINAPIADASFDPQSKSIVLRVDANQMRVLDPRLSAGKRANVQSNMLGPQVLDAAKYPRIEFRSTSIENRANGVLHVDGNLELHGQTRPISFDAAPGENGAFTGSANVRQTDFGITPIRIAGGAVSVRDDVRVEFTIQFIGGSAASRSLGRSHATIATHGEKRWLRLRR
jgi:hypothetical protein